MHRCLTLWLYGSSVRPLYVQCFWIREKCRRFGTVPIQSCYNGMGTPKTMDQPDQQQIILFDGLCNLCSGWVRFVARRDKKNRFRFAALQSAAGQRLTEPYGLNISSAKTAGQTIVLIGHRRVFVRSRAVLEILRQLSGLWPLCYVLVLIPSVLRDGLYRFIARNRYRWWGKKEVCMVPTAALQKKFLS